MRRRTLIGGAVAVVMAVALALGVQSALTAPDTQVPWHFLGGGGGGTASSTSFDLGATADQSAVGLAGSSSYDLSAGYWVAAIDRDADGLLDATDPCPDVADCDGDGWTDRAEVFIGTDPENACTPGGWAPDPAPAPDGNGIVQIDDVTFAASAFGSTTTPRAEIANQNGIVQIDDVTAFASRFGQTCG